MYFFFLAKINYQNYLFLSKSIKTENGNELTFVCNYKFLFLILSELYADKFKPRDMAS